MTTDHARRFGELRSLLHDPIFEDPYTAFLALRTLLEDAARDGLPVQEVWLPYTKRFLEDTDAIVWSARIEQYADDALGDAAPVWAPLINALSLAPAHRTRDWRDGYTEDDPGRFAEEREEDAETMRRLASATSLDMLTQLELSHCAITPAPFRALASAPHLRDVEELWMVHSAWSEGVGALIPRGVWAPRLHTLVANMVECPTDELLALVDGADHLPNLIALHLGGEHPRPGLASAIATAPWRLERLNLAGCGVTGEEAITLAQAPQLTGLTTLRLERNHIDGAGLAALVAAPYFGELMRMTAAYLGTKHLDWIAHNPIGDEGVAALTRSPHIAPCPRIDLSRAQLTDEGVRALTSSPHMHSTNHLILHDNHITAEGARLLSTAPTLANLRILALGDNLLGDAGVLALRDGPATRACTTIAATDAGLTPDGVRALFAAPLPEAWRNLHLSHTTDDDAAAHIIAASPHAATLETLRLTPTSSDARRALATSPHLAPNIRRAYTET